MRFFLRLSLAFLFAALAVVPRVSARTKETGFLDRSVTLHGTTYKYQVFVPDNWSSKQRWPVILFLHGAGERGSDGLLATDVVENIPKVIKEADIG